MWSLPVTVDAPTLLTLPAELIDQVLTYLSPYDVFRVARTCRLLHRHSLNDPLWQSFINENLPRAVTSPSPAKSYRDLFRRHHPHWFLPRHQIWFCDATLHGKLIYVRYDPRRGCIEGYTIVAERGPHEHGVLSWHNQVLYDTFRPKVKLDLNKPILRLDLQEPDQPLSFGREISMPIQTGNTRRLSSVFLPTRPATDELKAQSSASLWPPGNIPSPGDQRTRNQSPSGFNAAGHKPDARSQFSDATFRIRQWVEFGNFMPVTLPYMDSSHSVRVGEVVHTFGTLPKEVYTPTAEKPWQGIWCGDYGGHGCEFLLITQPDNPAPLPEKAQEAYEYGPGIGANNNSFGLVGMISSEEDDLEDDFEDESALYGGGPGPSSDTSDPPAHHTRSRDNQTAANSRRARGPSSQDKAPYKGRLEAIKLTGDPNVPRGEYTFIAPDIGSKGLVGHASETVFGGYGNAQQQNSFQYAPPLSYSVGASSADLSGARIVRGVGHIAGTGFSNDTYIPTQLIMISENRLAQYWLPFRHVSFFERVNLDAFLDL